MYDEKTLFRLVAGGDEAAFRQLFHHYNKMLQPFAVKLTKSPQAAEEVLQECFLKIWLHRDRLPEIENPKAYIVRIVSNESMNYLRKEAKDDRLLGELPSGMMTEPLSPEQSFTYRETELRLREAVDRLPLACRNIYRMSREQYMRIPEIAQTLNLSDSTVKNQLVKALRSIRLHIGNTLSSFL